MRIQKYNAPRKFQEGGVMPADPAAMGGDPAMMQEGAPQGAPQGGGEDAMMQQVAQVAQEIISSMGPEAAMMLAQVIMEMVQGGGGQAPVGQAPEGEPIFKRGGKICGRLKRGKKLSKCGK